MASDASGVDPTLLDALEEDLQQTQADGEEPTGSPVLRFDLTQADSAIHSGEFAHRHDEGIWRCFRQILEVSPCHRAQEFASLPLRHGGLGLRSAHRIHPAAH